MSLQAYVVLENYEGTGGIVFASKAVVARRKGANSYADGEFSGVSCRRAKWADRYAAQGTVPASVMVAYGWRYEGTCGHLISEDELHDRGLTCDEVVGYDNGGAVFCSPACAAEHERITAIHNEIATDAGEMIRAVLKSRYGTVEFPELPRRYDTDVIFVDGHRGWQSVTVSFSFPGMTIGLARAEIGNRHDTIGPPNLHVLCCSGDREAFEVFSARR